MLNLRHPYDLVFQFPRPRITSSQLVVCAAMLQKLCHKVLTLVTPDHNPIMKTMLLRTIAVAWLATQFSGLAQNATLITTIPNPYPGTSDHFGIAVVAVGDKVLVGAENDSTGLPAQAGAAYLFSSAGTLLCTFTNPIAEFQERFGFAVAAVGSQRVLIAAPHAQCSIVSQRDGVFLAGGDGNDPGQAAGGRRR